MMVEGGKEGRIREGKEEWEWRRRRKQKKWKIVNEERKELRR